MKAEFEFKVSEVENGHIIVSGERSFVAQNAEEVGGAVLKIIGLAKKDAKPTAKKRTRRTKEQIEAAKAEKEAKKAGATAA